MYMYMCILCKCILVYMHLRLKENALQNLDTCKLHVESVNIYCPEIIPGNIIVHSIWVHCKTGFCHLVVTYMHHVQVILGLS